MENNHKATARKLLEAFMRLRRLKPNFVQRNQELGLRHSEVMVLFCIGRKTPSGHEGIRVSQISSIMRVTPPTITQILNSLADGGYINRETDEKDRRSVLISLTDKGREVINQMSESMLATYTGIVDYLGEEKSEELIDLLHQVFTYLNSAQRSPFS